MMTKVTFKGIGIENLGPFRERQFLDLQVRAGRPIILVKALNGAGKTTLLTCLQVVLYGSKALGNGRASEYEQLIRGLHRSDAVGPARIDLDLRIESGGTGEDISISRQWQQTPARLNEKLVVARDGSQDLQLTEEWHEHIDAILPSELLQLFLFDGEKIEALASPKTLPEMLRRATEAFLGIGGIDTLSKDLIAVERRALLHAKSTSSNYRDTKVEVEDLQKETTRAAEERAIRVQLAKGLEHLVTNAQSEHAQYQAQAQRRGLDSFEKAAEILARKELAENEVQEAGTAFREALADPYLALSRLGAQWTTFKSLWTSEREARLAKGLFDEINRRDARLLQTLKAAAFPAAPLATLRSALSEENSRYAEAARRELVLIDSPDPSVVDTLIQAAEKRLTIAAERRDTAKASLADLERKVAAIPSRDQLSEVLEQLQRRATAVAVAQAQLSAAQAEEEEQTNRYETLETRLRSATERMGKELEGSEKDAKAIQAAQRARAVLGVFKEKLLASKATWLSEMITTEFKGLLHKRKLIEKVLVEPDTYAVSILAKDGQELPMERLSAGERQLLAVSVLSALIRERKGRFPVVVDTPLARLDRSHRQALIRRFFAKVSHQVMVLSTDEEVEGEVMAEMAQFTSAHYDVTFLDEEYRSSVQKKVA
jgi:DNA sulfur modification protein DndD